MEWAGAVCEFGECTGGGLLLGRNAHSPQLPSGFIGSDISRLSQRQATKAFTRLLSFRALFRLFRLAARGWTLGALDWLEPGGGLAAANMGGGGKGKECGGAGVCTTCGVAAVWGCVVGKWQLWFAVEAIVSFMDVISKNICPLKAVSSDICCPLMADISSLTC